MESLFNLESSQAVCLGEDERLGESIKVPKQDQHWCDRIKNKSETKFKIEEEAKALQKDIDSYLLHDIDIGKEDPVRRRYIYDKMYSILSSAENVVSMIMDANSIYAIYSCDFENRRVKWLDAKGQCFQLIAKLNTVAGIVYQSTNLSKYANLAYRYEKLAEKIKNVMISDDKIRKEKCKEYIVPSQG